MPTITALETQKRSAKRVNVYLDGAYAFSLSLDDAARLYTGQALTDAEVDALRNEDEVKRAVDRGLRLLASRPRSTREIRDALRQKDTPAPVIDLALERLAALGYLDDQAFATYWVRERTSAAKPIGARALRYELRGKGISDSIIASLLAEVDGDDAAYRAALAQVRKLRGSDRRTFRQKIGAGLYRRGFSSDATRAAIRRLLDEIDAGDPSFFAGTQDDDDYET